jgi:hypothetical protein
VKTGTQLPTMLAMAQESNEYARELASGFGQQLLRANGEPEAAAKLASTLLAALPGTTPKAKAARVALDTLRRTRGAMTGTIHAGRAKVDAASAPRLTTGFRRDTLIQRQGR